MISSDNINYIKFGVVCLRKYSATTNSEETIIPIVKGNFLPLFSNLLLNNDDSSLIVLVI
jgi:hypothetical protein